MQSIFNYLWLLFKAKVFIQVELLLTIAEKISFSIMDLCPKRNEGSKIKISKNKP